MTTPTQPSHSPTLSQYAYGLAKKIGSETKDVSFKIGVSAATGAMLGGAMAGPLGAGTGALAGAAKATGALAGLELLRIGIKSGLSYKVSSATANFVANTFQFFASTASLYAASGSVIKAGSTISTAVGFKVLSDKIRPKQSEKTSKDTVVNVLQDVVVGVAGAMAGNYIGMKVDSLIYGKFHGADLPQQYSRHGRSAVECPANPENRTITAFETVTDGTCGVYRVEGSGVGASPNATLTFETDTGAGATITASGLTSGLNSRVVASGTSLNCASVNINNAGLACSMNACEGINVTSHGSNSVLLFTGESAVGMTTTVDNGKADYLNTAGASINLLATHGANVGFHDRSGQNGALIINHSTLNLIHNPDEPVTALEGATIVICNDTVVYNRVTGGGQFPPNENFDFNQSHSFNITNRNGEITDGLCNIVLPTELMSTVVPTTVATTPIVPTPIVPTSVNQNATMTSSEVLSTSAAQNATATPSAVVSTSAAQNATVTPSAVVTTSAAQNGTMTSSEVVSTSAAQNATVTPTTMVSTSAVQNATVTPSAGVSTRAVQNVTSTTPSIIPSAVKSINTESTSIEKASTVIPNINATKSTPLPLPSPNNPAEPVIKQSSDAALSAAIIVPVGFAGVAVGGGIFVIVEARQAKKLQVELKKSVGVQVTFPQAAARLIRAKLSVDNALAEASKDNMTLEEKQLREEEVAPKTPANKTDEVTQL